MEKFDQVCFYAQGATLCWCSDADEKMCMSMLVCVCVLCVCVCVCVCELPSSNPGFVLIFFTFSGISIQHALFCVLRFTYL